MIYRIAIKDNGKFVRYASKKELRSLRVNSQGIVEMLDIQVKFIANYGRSDSVNIGYSISEDMWQDVSDTHEVEWGMLTGANTDMLIPIYDSDIYVDWNTCIDGKHTEPSVFNLMKDYDNLHPDQFPMIEIIGNVNENPELNGGSK